MTPKYSANAVRLKGTESELPQLMHSKEHVHALRNTRNDLVVHGPCRPENYFLQQSD